MVECSLIIVSFSFTETWDQFYFRNLSKKLEFWKAATASRKHAFR